MPVRQESGGSGDMRLTKFRALVQDTDNYLAGRTGSVFMFGGANAKYKTFAAAPFVNHTADPYIAIMASIFTPGKTGPLEKVDEIGLIGIYREMKNKSGEKNLNEFYRLVFWLLFGAAVCDEVYNSELSNIVDLAYCLGFDEGLMRDWCKVVAYIVGGNRLNEKSNIQLETAVGNAFFLHKKDTNNEAKA